MMYSICRYFVTDIPDASCSAKHCRTHMVLSLSYWRRLFYEVAGNELFQVHCQFFPLAYCHLGHITFSRTYRHKLAFKKSSEVAPLAGSFFISAR